MSGPPMGNAHRFDRDGEANRETVLLALGKGPRTGVELCHDLAAACGTKAAVSSAIDTLKNRGLIRGEHRSRQVVCWHLTLDGITEAMRLLTARQEARAGA